MRYFPRCSYEVGDEIYDFGKSVVKGAGEIGSQALDGVQDIASDTVDTVKGAVNPVISNVLD